MTLIILLFSLGIVFLAVEVIVPGGILGVIGGLMMIGGCVFSFIEFGSGGGFTAVLVALGVTAAFFYLVFKVIPKTSFGRKAFLDSEITAVTAAYGGEIQELVGKSARALTMLSPSGYVMIDGTRYDAFCQSGQAPAGAELEVIGADSYRLIVSESKSN